MEIVVLTLLVTGIITMMYCLNALDTKPTDSAEAKSRKNFDLAVTAGVDYVLVIVFSLIAGGILPLPGLSGTQALVGSVVSLVYGSVALILLMKTARRPNYAHKRR